jgi:hypothetical protein
MLPISHSEEIMTKKIWITLPLVYHHAGPRHDLRLTEIAGCAQIVGTEDVRTIPPNVPFEIDEVNGRYLVGLHGGRVVDGPAG